MSSNARRPASEVEPAALFLLELMSPALEWGAIAGSLRRGKPDVGDVEMVVVPSPAWHQYTDTLLKKRIIQHALYGEKQTKRWGQTYRGMLYQGIQFDVFCCDMMNRGYIYWLRTGPDNARDRANTTLMTALKTKHAPFTIKGGYCWYNEQKLEIPDEADFFALCGLPYIEPHERSASLYWRLLNKRGHQWGDPARWLRKQKTMFAFSFADSEEAEYRALSPGVKREKKVKPFAWGAPYVTDGGVWVYMGYGAYQVYPADHAHARRWHSYLNGVNEVEREQDARRLRSWLAAREAKSRIDMLMDVVTEAVEILQSWQIPVS